MDTAVRIAVFLSLLLLTGCGEGDPDAEAALDAVDQPVEIHAMLNNVLQDWEGQQEFVERFTELTGHPLRITQPPHQSYSDRVFLQLASTDVPDIVEILPEHLPRLVRGELVVPLNDFFADAQYMSSIHPAYLQSVRHPDGNLYGIPARDGGGCVTYIRADWLENLGLAMPRNYEELEVVLNAFTTMDPNRSGRNDTVAYTDVAGGSHDWYNRLPLGGGRIEIHYDYQRQEWVDGLTLPETREGLERLKRWYDAGYVDPDITTNTTFTARTKFINGQVGIFTYWANHWARNLQDRTEAADSPSARILPMPAPEGVRYIRRIPPMLVITAASRHPGLVFEQFIDRQYDKGSMQMLFTFGVEGYHWEESPSGIVFRTNPEDPYEASFTRSYVPPGSSINDWVLPVALDPLVAQSLAVLEADPYYEKQSWGGPSFSQYFLEIEERLKPNMIASFLGGTVSLDEALDRYRRDAQYLYLQEMLDEMNGIIQSDGVRSPGGNRSD
jgi:putative aldouronate transport system substrate-binding protein